MEVIIKPKKITKANFEKFGDIISTQNVEATNINNGYAKRFGNLANINISNDRGKVNVSIFSALKRSFPMRIDMMEKHPLGSQAFIPMKETTFLSFVAPQGEIPQIDRIESFIVPPRTGINYKPDIWHFPLISTENTNFLVIDRMGDGKNITIYKFEKEKIILEY